VWAVGSIPLSLLLWPTLLELLDRDGVIAVATMCLLLSFALASILQLFQLNPPSQVPKMVTVSTYMIRGLVGLVFMFVVIMVGKLDETLGAILGVFPVLGSVNLCALYTSSGSELIQEVVPAMIIGGTSVYVYALLFGILLPYFHIWETFLVAFCVSFGGVSVPLFFIIRERNKRIRIRDEKSTFSFDIESLLGR